MARAEENIPEGLTVFMPPPYHRTRTRTTNGLENPNKEIKRRTRVAAIFPNEASILRLVTAVVAEISEEWEAGCVYLNMETARPTVSFCRLMLLGQDKVSAEECRGRYPHDSHRISELGSELRAFEEA
jgi:transposase-like protein